MCWYGVLGYVQSSKMSKIPSQAAAFWWNQRHVKASCVIYAIYGKHMFHIHTVSLEIDFLDNIIVLLKSEVRNQEIRLEWEWVWPAGGKLYPILLESSSQGDRLICVCGNPHTISVFIFSVKCVQ